jgi:hypothetical protein
MKAHAWINKQATRWAWRLSTIWYVTRRTGKLNDCSYEGFSLRKEILMAHAWSTSRVRSARSTLKLTEHSVTTKPTLSKIRWGANIFHIMRWRLRKRQLVHVNSTCNETKIEKVNMRLVHKHHVREITVHVSSFPCIRVICFSTDDNLLKYCGISTVYIPRKKHYL